MFIWGGVDPGQQGAIAFIDEYGGASVRDVPTLSVGKKGKRAYDLGAMADIFRGDVIVKDLIIGLELVHAMPKQGVASMWSMGYGTGVWEGILAALQIPYQKITPQRWKGLLLDGLPKEKGSSIVVAKRLFPKLQAFTRKRDHNRSDALLIAEYLRRTYRPGQTVTCQLTPSWSLEALD